MRQLLVRLLNIAFEAAGQQGKFTEYQLTQMMRRYQKNQELLESKRLFLES